MRITLPILATLLLAANVAVAQAPGAAPTLKLVSSVDKDKGVILLRESVQVPVFVNVQVPYVENGVAKFKTVTETRHVVQERIATVQIANSRVITPDGKQLPIEDVWKRVKAKMVVAVSSNSATPAEPFLRALNAETLIIIAPMQPVEPPLPKKD